MTEKRYKGNKYIQCYCTKNDQILLGAKLYGIGNPIAIIGSVVLVSLFAVLGGGIYALGLFVLLVVPWFITLPLAYRDDKKEMLKAGHTEQCSKKVTQKAMLYASLWSDFKIMKDKDDGKRIWR